MMPRAQDLAQNSGRRHLTSSKLSYCGGLHRTVYAKLFSDTEIYHNVLLAPGSQEGKHMLEELKKRVIAIAQSAQRDGLCKHKSGNFSMRDPKTNYVVITPSGVDRELLTPEDMVVIDLDANVIEYRKGIRPSSEVLMHLMIYKTRPAVKAVAHTHSMYASVFAVLGKEIPAVVYEAMVLGLKTGVIPVAPYGRPGSMELAESVIEPVKISDALLLARHGALAVDEKDIESAYLKANYIEEFAEIYYHVLTVTKGTEPPVFGPEELRAWGYPEEIKFPQ